MPTSTLAKLAAGATGKSRQLIRATFAHPFTASLGLAAALSLPAIAPATGAAPHQASGSELRTGVVADPQADAVQCRALATLDHYPVPNVRILSAEVIQPNAAAGSGKPWRTHCRVRGIVDQRVGADGHPYGTRFELRLPLTREWNKRFLFQGSGATEATLRPAYGPIGDGRFALDEGWAVVSQTGGHDANEMFADDPELAPTFAFTQDKKAMEDFSYNSLDVTARVAKTLIETYYGAPAAFSYFNGCSMGGRDGLVFANRYPDYFNGIIAGEPGFNLQAWVMSSIYFTQQIGRISPIGTNGQPNYIKSFPVADQRLFMRALLEACDGLDGVRDGIVDEYRKCNSTFDPAYFRFKNGQALKCAGAKTDACLSPAEIDVIEKIHAGPVDAQGKRLRVPFLNELMPGVWYDGGFFSPTAGITSFYINPISAAYPQYKSTYTFVTGPSGANQFLPYMYLKTPRPGMNPVDFNFDHDMGLLNDGSVHSNFASSYDTAAFKKHGGKIILYGGQSSPGPSGETLLNNYERLGPDRKSFSRVFFIPNMGHCSGGYSTSKFDMLTPLVAWVEEGRAPERVPALGTNFPTAPPVRRRPLCAYPKVAHFIGAAGGDLSQESNYSCVAPRT